VRGTERRNPSRGREVRMEEEVWDSPCGGGGASRGDVAEAAAKGTIHGGNGGRGGLNRGGVGEEQ